MRIALLHNNVVENIAEFDSLKTAYDLAMQLERIPIAVDGLPIAIGDELIDGEFTRKGVKFLPTIKQANEKINILEGCIFDLAEAIFGGEE